MNPLISIVMAVYNGEKYLAEQIQSILAQTYKNIELIIADDASSDRSLQIAEEFVRKDSRVIFRKNAKNLGVVKNFLNALALSQGEWICFSDQDDIWENGKLKILATLIEEDYRNMLACSDLAIFDERRQTALPSFWTVAGIRPPKGHLGEIAFLRNLVPGCSMMFRREVKDCLLKLPEEGPFMHDHLAFVVGAALGRVVFTKEKLLRYRQHSANQIGAFYDSAINKERIIRELTEKVEFMRGAQLDSTQFQPEKLLAFCDCLRGGDLLKRLFFLRYYLFLRNHQPLDQALGILDCLAPTVYTALKKIGDKKVLEILMMRIIFTGWSILVLAYFFAQFIVPKIDRFLSWIR
jgi:glycosyltransferase involved in cell wall biosynthesis